LDVSATTVKLEAKGYSTLSLKLPYEVLEDKGRATFDKSKKKLIITLPVVPPKKILTVQESLPLIESTLDHKELDNELENEEKSIINVSSVIKASAIDHTRWVDKTLDISDSFAELREFASMALHDKPRFVLSCD